MKNEDVVLKSVQAYSDNIETYIKHNETAVLETVESFSKSLTPNSSILDAGCGPGRDIKRFKDLGHEVVGLDLNPDFVNVAKKYGNVILGDLRSLPFKNVSFDAVWACTSLVHLPFEDAKLTLEEFKRVLKPSGSLYVSVKYVGETGWVKSSRGERWFQIWDSESFVKTIETTGFKVSKIELGKSFIDVWATKQ